MESSQATSRRLSRTATQVRRAFDHTAILVGVGLLLLVDTMAMMVPLLATIGAGIVGGFVAAYIAGGVLRGAVHALIVGVVGGIALGYLTALVGVLLGMYLEPPTLLGGYVGIVAPEFSVVAPEVALAGALEPLSIIAVITAMVAVDAVLAGLVGGTLRSLVDAAR